MQQSITQWLALFALCLALIGCGEEKAGAPKTAAAPETPEAAEFAEVVVEIDGARHYPKTEDQSATNALRGLAQGMDAESVKIDPDYQRTDQLRLIVKPADRADAAYTELKTQFDRAAREAVEAELSAQKSLVQTTAEDVLNYQQLMQRFQQGLAVQVEVNGTKLDRRRLDRLLTTTLASQIEAEKRVASLQQQIDRERYAKLLRIR